MGLIFNPVLNNVKTYTDEKQEFLENFIKLTGRKYLFENFESKLTDTPTPESLRQDLIILISLVEGVKNNELKTQLYHEIISDLVLLVCAGYEQ